MIGVAMRVLVLVFSLERKPTSQFHWWSSPKFERTFQAEEQAQGVELAARGARHFPQAAEPIRIAGAGFGLK